MLQGRKERRESVERDEVYSAGLSSREGIRDDRRSVFFPAC